MSFHSGASRGALSASTIELDRVVDVAGTDLAVLGDELFAVGDLLGREAGLRRMLTDASRPAEQRAGVANQLLADRVSGPTRDVVTTLVTERWSRPRDLLDAIDDLAVRAIVAGAEADGTLDNVEDEVFRFRRIVAGDGALRAALADFDAPVESKRTLIDALLDDKVEPATRRLVDHAVSHPGRESFDDALDRYGRLAAERRQRLVAAVRTPVALTDEQEGRLSAALHRLYGRDVVLNVEIDRSVLGGLAVQVGDEIIDGTVLTRLDDARRRLDH